LEDRVEGKIEDIIMLGEKLNPLVISQYY